MTIFPRLLLPTLLLLLPAGCASPDPSYYNLKVVPGAVLRGAPHVVEVRHPGLAGYLDRQELVLANDGTHLQVANYQLWGENLGNLTSRTLADDLAQRLPGSTIFSNTDAIALDPDTIVETNIQRFDADGEGHVLLAAQIVVRQGYNGATHKTNYMQTIKFSVPIPGQDAHAIADGMCVALGQMADNIAYMLHNLPYR